MELPGRFFAYSSEARGFVKASFAAEGFGIPWHRSRFFSPASIEELVREVVCVSIDPGRMWGRGVRAEVAGRIANLERLLYEHWMEVLCWNREREI